jgi:succinate-acetate transporter protein
MEAVQPPPSNIQSSMVRFGYLNNKSENNIVSNNGSSSTVDRLVVVRYYLDRAGYNINNSSSRIWVNPPKQTTPSDIENFLQEQGIKSIEDTKLLVELYLDAYHSYMLLEVCTEHMVHFDFTSTTSKQPGTLDVRLTDLNEIISGGGKGTKEGSSTSAVPRCNTSPVGLFAFAMTVGLDALNVLRELLDDDTKIDPSFLLIWGPYAFFVSGLVQFVVGINEISRNNIYGATAFLAFGCFWMANGTVIILKTYFPDEIPDSIRYSTSSNAPDTFVRECYVMIFACALFKQTLIMNKVTTGLIGTLIIYVFTASLGGWNDVFLWMKVVLGFILSIYALFVFYAEFTNEVYQRTVVNLYPWNSNSSVEAFGAAGRENMLQVRAIDLRTAGHHNILHAAVNSNTDVEHVDRTHKRRQKPSNHSPYHLRSAQPEPDK